MSIVESNKYKVPSNITLRSGLFQLVDLNNTVRA